jgi:antiviral helicase SKI2
VHFILDEQRGHVWEKTMLMLPAHVQLIMLSATLSDPLKLAHFVENRYRDHPKQVVWSSTSRRIVPLNHYAYVITTEGAYKKIKDKETQTFLREATHRTVLLKKEDGVFQETGYNTVKKVKQLLNTHQIYIKRSHVLNTLSKHLVEHDMLPAIVFTFSRKNVEQCAHEITTNLLEFDSKVPYTARRMAEQIVRKLPNYHEYLGLPEYESLVQLLEKGVAIHHSGMIPILREVVELFIERKMVKMLFATDSFSVGLNCAIKTTVFTGLRKFDGVGEQFLAPHLYSQCAGRAGRRGMDTVGHVIHCANLFDLPSVTDYREILCGKPQKMESKFHIAYDVVLNLIKNGQHADFHTFVEKSMVFDEIQTSQQTLREQLEKQNKELALKEEFMATKLRTPVKVMAEYMDLKEALKSGPQKKRREVERAILSIEDKYKCSMFYKDLEVFHNVTLLKLEMGARQADLDYLATFIRRQVAAVVAILEERKFITTEHVVLPPPYAHPHLTTRTFDTLVTPRPFVEPTFEPPAL